jgi:nitroreductase
MLKQIEMRRSVRKYLDQAVEEEKLLYLLESARVSPSGNNTQPWHFIVIKSNEMREKIAEVCHHQKWMVSAPVYIVCVADMEPRSKGKTDFKVDENSPESELKQIIRDTAIAAEHIVLEAENQGLGTCWIAWFTQAEIREALKIPGDKYVVAVLTVGYPAVIPQPTPRKKIEEIVRYETWK